MSTKVRLVKDMIFPVVMYGYESWTIKKAERWRTGAFKLWYWSRLLRFPRITRRSNQSILKAISPEYSLEGLMLKLKLQYFGHLMWTSADEWIRKLWYIYTVEYYSAIKKNTFESVLMRWMKLEPIIQSEVSQKEKHQYSILTYMELRKMVMITLYVRQQKRHRCIEQSFGLCGRGQGWGDLGEWLWNIYIIICKTNRHSRFDAWDRVLGAGALGWPRGMVWGGRREGVSGWGTHVHP